MFVWKEENTKTKKRPGICPFKIIIISKLDIYLCQKPLKDHWMAHTISWKHNPWTIYQILLEQLTLWSFIDLYDHSLISMINLCSLWSFFNLYDHFLISMIILWSLWSFFDLYYHSVVSMIIHWSLLSFFDLYDHSLISMIIHWSLWSLIDLFNHSLISMIIFWSLSYKLKIR